MLKQVEPFLRRRLARPWAQWTAVIAASAALSALLGLLTVPAAMLLGPLVASVFFGVGGASISVPRPLFLLSQGVAGCLIASSLTLSTLVEIADDWPALVLAVSLTLAASLSVGLLAGRLGRMPRDAAIWGFLPGMAGAMVAAAHEENVDARLVAVMQYVRLLVVILVMSAVARVVVGPSVAGLPTAPLSEEPLVPVAVTMAVAALAWAGAWLRFIPSGPSLVPMVVAAALQVSGTMPIALPGPVLMVAYAVIGIQVGLRFNRPVVMTVVRLVPLIVAASLALVVLCGLSAVLLTAVLDLDTLTAFLGTVPGSIETVAIIAVASKVDVAFVMALQTMRLFVVILVGPPLARLACRFVK